MLEIVLLLFLLTSHCQMAEGRVQSVRIRGIFRCDEEIPRNATIELWEEDDPLQNFFYQFFHQKNSMKFFCYKRRTNVEKQLGFFL